MKAEIAARESNAARVQAEFDAEHKANADFYNSVRESNAMYMTNVALLDEGQIVSKISYITSLIQSGEAERYRFQSGNGDQTTTSIHQYLYWLQLREKELNSDGTYTPEMFK